VFGQTLAAVGADWKQLRRTFNLVSTAGMAPGSRVSNPWYVGQTVREIYEIRKLLGRGGFGIVYKAWDRAEHRHIAIKLSVPHGNANESDARHFAHEATLPFLP